MTAKVRESDVLNALRNVNDPELGKDLVTLGMIKDVHVEDGAVRFKLILTTPACPLKAEIERMAREAVERLEGVKGVRIDTGSNVSPGRVHSPSGLPEKMPIPGVKNIIAVASGKGGVGKSTVSVNLAAALSQTGALVGLMDSDIYGPSVPLMMGVNDRPSATAEGKILPLEKHGVKLISIGFLLEEDTAVIWRGPMVMKMVTQFLEEVDWGELDYLVVDLPPGTGDAQLTLAQTVPINGAVIVTTPQDIALLDARRGIRMFQQVGVPVLGIVENMSYFLCPHCGGRTDIFSHDGGKEVSERYGTPLLGQIPLHVSIREGSDQGRPLAVARPDSPEAAIFRDLAGAVAARLSVILHST